MSLRALEGELELPDPPPAPDVDDEGDDLDPAMAIRCKACGHPIAREEDRVDVHGAHEHRRVNPSGRDFHVGCFARAPGCFAAGEPTFHWTWFPGYAWRVAGCRGCGEHLGWEFSGEGEFHGLILPKLLRP